MKRIFSIIVACIMLVSCFAAMSVSAEEPTSWTMPIDWSTGHVEQSNGWDVAVQGAWKFLSFTDLSDTTTFISNPDAIAYDEMTTFDKEKTPYPYVGANHNEQKAQNNPSVSKYDITKWYVNHDKRWGGIMFQGHTTDAIAFTADGEQKGAIIFTAPEAGTYSYAETVEVLLAKTTDDQALTYEITVRKNGQVLTTFVPTDSESSKNITGEVELAAGDLLMFAFEQTSHITLSSSNAGANDPKCVSISGVTVTKKAAPVSTKVRLEAEQAVLSGTCAVRGNGTQINGFSTSDSEPDSNAKFILTVPTAGTYTITVNVEVHGDGSYRVKVGDGEYVGSTWEFTDTSAHDVEISLELKAGENEVYIAVAEKDKDYDSNGANNNGYFFLDYIEYDPQEVGTGTGSGTQGGGSTTNPDTNDSVVAYVAVAVVALFGIAYVSKKH